MSNPLERLTSWVHTHRAPAAALGLGGAAALALYMRKRASSSTSSSTSSQPASIVGGAPTDTAGLAAQVLGQVQPQLDTLAGQIGNLTPPSGTLSQMQSQITAANTAATAAKSTAAAATARLANESSLVSQLQRQLVVRTDPSQIKTAADVRLLSPSQQADFSRYINAVNAQQHVNAAAATPPRPAPVSQTARVVAPAPTRQQVVRADPSQVRNAADVALLTPSQQKQFGAYITAINKAAASKPAPAKAR